MMPRDGRGHQSHVICGYMYNHASSLQKEIEKLVHLNEINREKTPCILVGLNSIVSASCTNHLFGSLFTLIPAKNSVLRVVLPRNYRL